jgi:hypothetical protein
MNITPFEMYLITILDSICFASSFIAFASLILSGCFCISGLRWYFIAISVYVFIISFSVAIFTPSTKQMAAILIIPKIANSEKVEKIGNGLYDLAIEWMNELNPSKKEGAK